MPRIASPDAVMLARDKHRHGYGLLTLLHATESAAPLLEEVEIKSVKSLVFRGSGLEP